MKIYSQEDQLNAYAQKKKLFTVFLIVTIVYAVVAITSLVLYILLPYKDPAQTAYSWTIYLSTAGYIVFAFLFMGIKYKRSKSYCRFMKGLDTDLKGSWQGEFCGFYEGSSKDGVDVDICVIRNWNKKKQIFDEHHFHIDREKDIPPFEFGDEIKIVTIGSIIIEYEILKKGEIL